MSLGLLEPTMKELKFAASVVSLTLLVSGSVSCSSAPPPPAESGGVPAAAVGLQPQVRHVPDPVINGRAPVVGACDLKQTLQIALHLPLRNQAELTRLLHDLYDPTSPSYHKYLSVAAFTDRFGPTERDYDTVVDWAEAHGLTVTDTTPNRRLVAVEGPVKTVNRAFQVTVNNYRHPSEGRIFYSPDRVATPVGLKVQLLQITGMTNYVLPHSMLKHAVTNPPAVANLNGSGPSGEYLPSDMRAAYYGNGPLTGAGQSIGIFSFDGYLASDVKLYYSKTGMSSKVPIKNVLVDGFSGACTSASSPTSSTCDDGEQVLDIVNAIGMAPGIKQILFYEGSSNTEILNQMATDNVAKVLSSSWGWNPADAASDDPIFQEFAAQGQTFVSASGDDGAFNSSTYYFPSVDQYITQVGGTDLTTTGPTGSWAAETGWSHSGGGYVSGTPIPSWQQLPGVVNSSNLASTTLRNSPDVAAEANLDNPTVVNGNFVTGYGGTSFAAPRWAGFLALVNQQSVANGKGTVGFINPALYNLGVSTSYSSAFHDITSGSNPPSAGGSGFSAVRGYDLVTGWGSPAGAGLINQLAGSSASQRSPAGR
jgi:subtilase family serine protease